MLLVGGIIWTSKHSSAERNGDEIEVDDIGLFHQLDSELTDSLIDTAKRNAGNLRRSTIEALRIQAEAREEKVKAIQTKKWMLRGRC